MANETLTPDGNTRNIAGALTDDSNAFIKKLRIDDTTKGLKVLVVGGTGTGTLTTVEDGITTVANATTIDFTSGAVVTNLGGGVAGVAISGSSGITIGTTTITSGTNTRILYDNAGVVGEYTLTGSGTVVAMATSPVFQTSINGAYLTASQMLITDGSNNIVSAPVATYPSLTELSYVKGVTSAIQTQITGKQASNSNLTSVAGLTYVSASFVKMTGANTFTLDTNTYALTNQTMYIGTTAVAINRTTGALALTGITSIDGTATNLSGTPALPNGTTATTQSANDNSTKLATTAYVDGNTVSLTTNQTITGQKKFNNIIDVNNAITASGNAATVPVTYRLNTVKNNSAATLTITMTTTSAVDGQMTIVRIYDFSGVAETITWVNTENSLTTAPVLSNGSTTLPLTVGFQFNSTTSLWRCISLS